MKRAAVVLTALLCLTGSLAGCSSTMMQGTPFYRGPKPEGKAPDRVNLWPIVYYQHPILSVLWPLGQFDSARHRNRFFPAFWGSPEEEAPYFYVPPLAWFEKGQVAGVFPLFYDSRDAAGNRTLLTPLYMMGRNGQSLWDLVVPFFYRSKGPEGTRMAAFPLLSALTTGPLGKELWALFPLSHWRWQDGLQQAHVLPLFYWDRAADTFLSLPYARWKAGETRYTSVVGPLYVRKDAPDARNTSVLWPLTSFLWRVFRYEWDKDKGTRVHVLFIPFGGGKGEQPEPAKPEPSEAGPERMAAAG